MAPCRNISLLSDANWWIWITFGGQWFIVALANDSGLCRFTRCMPVCGHLGALMMRELSLQTTVRCLFIIAVQLLSHKRSKDIRVVFLLSGHIWAVLQLLDAYGRFGSCPFLFSIMQFPLDNNIGGGLETLCSFSMGQSSVLWLSVAAESRKAIAEFSWERCE